MTREEAIEVLKDIYNYKRFDTYTTNEARTMAIKALEQKPCDDCVSRSAVLDLMQIKMGGKELYKAIYELPPVTPKRKQGEWIFEEVGVRTQVLKCSKCGTIIQRGENFTQEEFKKYINDILREKCITLNNFCHNCGAEMKTESED